MNDSETFITRNEVHGALGSEYENLNIASIVFKLITDDNIQDFKLSSNDAAFGNFDDITFNTKSGELIQQYALQLKHSSRCLSLKQLNGEHGDFALSKYFESYKKISELDESCKFILFTNMKVTNWEGKKLFFEKQNFSVTLSKENVMDLINNSKAGGTCYRLTKFQTKANEISTEQEQYKKFFENFYLYTNQANVSQLEKSLCGQFEEKFCCSDTTAFKTYKEFISKWSRRKGEKEKLSKSQMKRVVAFCVLSRSIQHFVFGPITKKIRLLQKAISMFEVTIFKKSAVHMIKQIWADKNIDLVNRLEEVIQIRKIYQLNSSYELNEEDSTKILWLLEICPLVVTASTSTYEIIQLCNKDKFVLLKNGPLTDELHDRSIFQNLADLNSSSDVYKKITRSYKYSVQGKEESFLETLFEQNRYFRQNISTDDLLLMSEKTCIVGGVKESLPTPYINRELTRNIIDIDYLKKIDENTLVVIDSLSRNDEIRRRVRSFNLIDVSDYLFQRNPGSLRSESNNSVTKMDRNSDLTASTSGPDLYISQDECSKENFTTMFQFKNVADRYHHLRATADGLEWIRSLSDIDDLQSFRLVHGTTKESQLSVTYNKINVITAEPGMGKSVLMKNLKNNSPSTFWTIIFYTEDISSIFTYLNGEDIKVNSFKNYLLNVKYAHLKSFDKKILQMSLLENRVVYIWDAMDEISKQELDLITNIIMELSKENVNQWVTCRCHLKKTLESKFNVFSKNLTQFNEEQQFYYIEERLRSKSQNNIPSEIKKIRNLIVHHDIFGVPLQIFMLTELFLENSEKYSHLSKENVTDIYKFFIDEKFDIYYRRSFLEITRNNREQMVLDDHQKNKFAYYQKSALRSLVGPILKEFYECEEFLKEIRTKGDPIGIITEVTDDIIPRFIHKSFAEYFVALYFVQEFNTFLKEIRKKGDPLHKSFAEYFIALHFVQEYRSINNFQDMIFKDTQENIRFFFDLLMANNAPANTAVLYKNTKTLQSFGDNLNKCKDLGQRNVLHIACSWGQKYPTFPISYENSTYIIDTSSEKNFFVSKEDPKYIEMLRYLLEKCNASEKDELFNYTALEYAQNTKNFFAKAIIMQMQDQPIKQFMDDESIASVLYYSAKFGYSDFISLYETFPFIKTQDGSTFLHLSICQQRFFLELLKFDVYKETIDYYDDIGLTALSKACQQGQYTAVKHLLKYGANINIPSKDGRTPLHYACEFGYGDIALLLLQAGTNINVRDNKLRTPLYLSCFNGHIDVASLLLNEGADCNLANDKKWTPLHSACINGHDKIVELLIHVDGEANVHETKVNSEEVDWTPLHSASQHGHDKVVALLLKVGINSNLTTRHNRTPLHYACENGHEKVVGLLCEYGTNVNAVTEDKWTPLHIATDNDNFSIVKTLFEAGSHLNVAGSEGRTALHIAALRGYTKIAKFLIENNADLESETDDGRRPLHFASQFGNDQIVKLLTKHNCNLNPADKKGLTPLHLSCMNKQYKVAQILIDCKADVNVVTNNKKTALHYACQYGHEDAVKLLLISKADIEASDSKNITPLHLACYNGHEKIVEWLLIAQADVKRVSKNGWTALHHTSHTGHVKIAEMLISCGADINSTIANSGKTALYIASQEGREEIVHLLVNKGASVNCKTKEGRTPLHAAVAKKHYRVASFLTEQRPIINIDSCDNANMTPLLIACENEHFDLIQLLVTSGANINAANNEGLTPLHIICINGNNRICDHLLKIFKSINIDATDNEKRTALYFACQRGQNIIYHKLIAAGANITLYAKDRSTILHAACQNGNVKVVEDLLRGWQEVNVRDIKGCTPLHYACKYGHHEVVTQLSLKNADVDAKDVDDKTPLHNACENGHQNVVEILLKAGAKRNPSTKYGVTPVFLASRNGHKTIVALLDDRCCTII